MAEESNADKLIWFLAGVTVGAALGILFAPKAGSEMRQYLGEKGAAGRDYLTDTGRDIYSKGRDLYDRGKGLAEEAADLFDRGRKGSEKAEAGHEPA